MHQKQTRKLNKDKQKITGNVKKRDEEYEHNRK